MQPKYLPNFLPGALEQGARSHRPSTFWARPTGVAGCREGGGRESGCCDIIYGWHVAPCAGASEVAPPGLSVSPLHLDSMRSSH